MKIFLVNFMLLVFISCSSPKREGLRERLLDSDKGEFKNISIQQINGNQFYNIERTIGKFHFQYLTIIHPAVSKTEELNIDESLDEVSKNFVPGILRIKLDDRQGELLQYELTSEEEYKRRVEYYSFHINNDIKLVSKTDTLKCLFSTFERTYGVSPDITINCYFEKPKANNLSSGYTIVFEDRYFNCGIVNLTMPNENI